MHISSAAAGWVEYMVFYDIVYISQQTWFVYCAATLVSLLSCDPIPLREVCMLVHPVPHVQCLHIWEIAILPLKYDLTKPRVTTDPPVPQHKRSSACAPWTHQGASSLANMVVWSDGQQRRGVHRLRCCLPMSGRVGHCVRRCLR